MHLSDPDNWRDWLRLRAVPGIGDLLFKRLMDRFSTPQAVFGTNVEALQRVAGVSPRLATRILGGSASDAIERELDLTVAKGYRIVTLNDPGYPELLKEIPDPPPVLYSAGHLAGGGDRLAIVGSRNPTDYGVRVARRLAGEAADVSLSVVSGLARGIDTAAHQGCLSAGGSTIAVLGTGLERIYPRENRGLAARIAESGAVISEFPLTAGPDAHHFPRRNRVISGMCRGTVVIEAGRRSGSLITARLAVEQNREVFAVPGSIFSYKSAGPHELIRQGARLVTDIRDIIEELGPLIRLTERDAAPSGQRQAARTPTPDEARVLSGLGPYPVHIDRLLQESGLPMGRLSGILMQLELTGVVRQLPGKQFVLADTD